MAPCKPTLLEINLKMPSAPALVGFPKLLLQLGSPLPYITGQMHVSLPLPHRLCSDTQEVAATACHVIFALASWSIVVYISLWQRIQKTEVYPEGRLAQKTQPDHSS